MADKASTNRQCPFCREEIRADALRCRHCHAAIVPEHPDHGGTCPFCKEQINPEAIRCKHCQADLAPTTRSAGGCAGCGGGQARGGVRYAGGGTRSTVAPRKAVPRNTRAAAERSNVLFDEEIDPACAAYDIDDAGTWCFIESSEHFCIYELCDPVPTSPYTVFR
jgi:hypothetical protein